MLADLTVQSVLFLTETDFYMLRNGIQIPFIGFPQMELETYSRIAYPDHTVWHSISRATCLSPPQMAIWVIRYMLSDRPARNTFYQTHSINLPGLPLTRREIYMYPIYGRASCSKCI